MPEINKTSQLSELSDGIQVEWEEPVIPRYNGKRVQTIEGAPAPGYSIEEARQILEKEIEKLQLPDGYEIQWGGEKKATDMSMENLFSNYPLAILLMFAILIWLFRSYRTSLLLFCCIPFVFVGVIPAMLLSGQNFGFVAIVGVLGLVGMMLKNGIVLIDEMQLQLKSGKDRRQALIDASLSRLRPVTMCWVGYHCFLTTCSAQWPPLSWVDSLQEPSLCSLSSPCFTLFSTNWNNVETRTSSSKHRSFHPNSLQHKSWDVFSDLLALASPILFIPLQ